MARIAVLGSAGYVGSAIFKELSKYPEHSLTGVTLENYQEKQVGEYDILINCAMPSGKFWAKNNPEQDFLETVKKTADFLYQWKYQKFIQVSTVSARCQLDSIYGRHKAAAEQLCNFGENLIMRLGVIYSADNQKGPLFDILQGNPVYVDGSSRFSFIPLEFCAKWIASHLERKGMVELGGKNAVTLQEVADYLKKKINFEGEVTHLDVENEQDNLPEAKEVFTFLDSLKV